MSHQPLKKMSAIDYVTEAARLFSEGLLKHEVREGMIKKYGLRAASIRRYISHAQKLLIMRSGISKDQHRGEALEWYYSCIRDPRTPRAVALKARERIDKILGLEGPTVIHHEGAVNLVETHRVLKQIEMDPEVRRLISQLSQRQRALEPQEFKELESGPLDEEDSLHP